MVEANNLENRCDGLSEGIAKRIKNIDNELKKSRHLRKIVMGITVGVVTVCAAGIVYFTPKILEEIRIKNSYIYCHHIKAEALKLGREYHLERARPPYSEYNCLEIEQHHKELNK